MLLLLMLLQLQRRLLCLRGRCGCTFVHKASRARANVLVTCVSGLLRSRAPSALGLQQCGRARVAGQHTPVAGGAVRQLAAPLPPPLVLPPPPA